MNIVGAREAGDSRYDHALSPASRARLCCVSVLGLAPQALCLRPLRGLNM